MSGFDAHPMLEKWNSRYLDAKAPGQVIPVLKDNAHLLPAEGKALDLAAGLGANSLFLAKQGLETYAWDISNVANAKLLQFAKQRKLNIQVLQRDVESNPPNCIAGKECFDVIVVSHFLDRDIISSIKQSLNKGGVVFYQTFTQERTEDAQTPGSPKFCLAKQELLTLFSDFKILVYREEGLQGNCELGFRNEAMLIAQKIS